MALFRALILATSLWYYSAAVSAAESLKDNSADCSCYRVDSDTDAAYFQYHRFYDFRYLAESPNDYNSIPPQVSESQSAGQEKASNQPYLNGDSFTQDWNVQNW